MKRFPLFPVGQQYGKELKSDIPFSQRTYNGLPGELPPKRTCCTVVHKFVATIEKPRGSKCGWLPIDLGGIHDSGTAECSIGKGNRFSAQGVVGHFVDVHDAEWVRSVLTVNRDSEHSVVGVQVVGLGGL